MRRMRHQKAHADGYSQQHNKGEGDQEAAHL